MRDTRSAKPSLPQVVHQTMVAAARLTVPKQWQRHCTLGASQGGESPFLKLPEFEAAALSPTMVEPDQDLNDSVAALPWRKLHQNRRHRMKHNNIQEAKALLRNARSTISTGLSCCRLVPEHPNKSRKTAITNQAHTF